MACESRAELGRRGLRLETARTKRFAFSARLIRRIAISHVCRMRAARRKLSLERIPLNRELCWIGPEGKDPLDFSLAFDELEANDAEKSRALELRYFLGCTVEETAKLLGIAPSSVDQDVRFSLAWMNRRLAEFPSQEARRKYFGGA